MPLRVGEDGSEPAAASSISNGGIEDADHELPISLYCVISTPFFGNFYHWDFATYDPNTQQWFVLGVVQEEEDGPFNYEKRYQNPLDTTPGRLLFLGQVRPVCRDTLMRDIGLIQVPGEAASWDCQDYVMEIWEIVREYKMVDDDRWWESRRKMVRYFGQDFGGEDSEREESEVEEDEDDQEGRERRILSEEFVYDSSDSSDSSDSDSWETGSF